MRPVGSCLFPTHSTSADQAGVKKHQKHTVSPSRASSRLFRAGQLTAAARSVTGALAAVVLSLPVYAGGLDEPHTASDPCLPAATMTDEMLRGWQAMLAMKAAECGPPPVRAFFDRATGDRLSDDEILRRVFDGSRIEVVPLPAGGWLLLAGIGALVWRGRR